MTDEETGPDDWRYSSSGRSFVAFAHELVGDEYVVVAGRGNVASITWQINDYPNTLDLPRSPDDDTITFNGRHGQLVLTDGPGFTVPAGTVRINVHDPDGDGVYTGCAKSPLIENFGFVKPEGGDFVQREYFKVYAETNSDGLVTFYEFTEISTFKDTTA